VAVQLARDAGAHVVATGREAVRSLALELGAETFVDLDRGRFEEAVGPVDLVLDTIGGDALARSAAVVKPGGALVPIAGWPPEVPAGRRAVFFVVQPDRAQLAELAQLVDAGRLRPHVGAVYPLVDGREAFRAKATLGVPGRVVLQP
jgi:NADPH:quinone reductase-like Zn-dependent oxidoreductase